MQTKFQSAILFFKKNKAHNITMVVALVMTIVSYSILIQTDSHIPSEELLGQADQEVKGALNKQNEDLTVDISGAVNKPGVYSLPIGSRLMDAIKRADELSYSADTQYFYKTFNRASLLTDQQKIYIPMVGDGVLEEQISSEQNEVSLTSVNSATQSELDELPGLGPITVEKIIDNRPYTTIQDLTDKKIISNSIYEKIKEKITL